MREKRTVIIRNLKGYLGWLCSLLFLCTPAGAQYYYPSETYPDQYYYGPGGVYTNDGQTNPRERQPQQSPPQAHLQYDQRDAEMILREQVARSRQYQNNNRSPEQRTQQSQQIYDDYYGHRINDEGQLQQVLAEAKYVGGLVKNRNGKAFIVIDKRNFQFYLFSSNAGLLRIGPVAIGKGKTGVGAFETPVGIFPIKQKVAVDDWIRPDWYFIEENEPIPQRWEDRRVPGFFRYKLVFEGSRYIHYAEATGGRLTHGCLGLDWQDAEAVFHTLQVASHCIIMDQAFLSRLARGEYPVQKPPAPVAAATGTKQEKRSIVAESQAEPSGDDPVVPTVEPLERAPVVSAPPPPVRGTGVSSAEPAGGEKVLRNLW